MPEEIAPHEFEKTLRPGETLFHEGESGEQMFLIRSGKVRISKRSGQVEKTLAVLKEGDFFGEMALIDGSPRSATATALEETRLLIVDREAFKAQLKENPMIEYVLETMSRRLRATNRQVEFLLIRDELRRVVAMIQSLAKERGITTPDGGVVLDFDYSYEDFGNTVGITAEKAKELLHKLLNIKLIRLEEKKMTVPSMNDLDEYMRYITLKEKFKEAEKYES
ncbi:MAG: Crp/Fnr family transcriptional regulator [Candidatus Edwardsbacteria bacterium]